MSAAPSPPGDPVAHAGPPARSTPAAFIPSTSGVAAVAAGLRARRLLLRRRLEAELAQGRARVYGIAAAGAGVAVGLFAVAAVVMWFATSRKAYEIVGTGTSFLLLFLSGALVLSSLGHAAQSFFSAKDLWFWDSTPVPPWARFVDRASEAAVAALPTTVAVGLAMMLGICAGASLGPLAMLRGVVAVVLVAAIPLAVGIVLAHVGGALLPAGKLRRISLVLLGVGVAGALVWFRRARFEKVLTPEGAAELLENARLVRQVGPKELPSSVGAAFVVDGSALGFLGLLGWAAGALALAFACHRLLSRRARDLAVDESPIGILRGSLREAALKLAVRPAPPALRPVVEKDLLAFLRDPGQWGQVLLLLGVGALYLVNADMLRQGFAAVPEAGDWALPAMHTGLVCFIAAGLAVRFAFPQVGLEGPAIWIIDGSPLKPDALLRAKWISSLPVVVIYPALVALAGAYVLRLHPSLWVSTSTICVAVAAGVAAFGVGRGAIKPLFDAASLSELAMGPGAISTMMLSVLLAFMGSVGALAAGIGVVAAEHGFIGPVAASVISALGTFIPCGVALEVGRRSLARGAAAFARRREDDAERAFGERERVRPRTDAGIVVDE